MHCETPLSFLMSYSTIDRARSQCRYSHHTSHGSHSNVISLSSRVDAPSKAPSRQHRAPYGIVLYRVMFSECSAILPYAANRSKALNNWPVTMLRKFALSQCSIAWLLLFDCSAMALIFQQLSFSFYWVYAFHLVSCSTWVRNTVNIFRTCLIHWEKSENFRVKRFHIDVQMLEHARRWLDTAGVTAVPLLGKERSKIRSERCLLLHTKLPSRTLLGTFQAAHQVRWSR